MHSVKSRNAYLGSVFLGRIFTILAWVILLIVPVVGLISFMGQPLPWLLSMAGLIAGLVILWKLGLFKKPLQPLISVDVYEYGFIYYRFGTTTFITWQEIDFFTSTFGRFPQLNLYVGEKIVFSPPFLLRRGLLMELMLRQLEPIFIDRLLKRIHDGETIDLGEVTVKKRVVGDIPIENIQRFWTTSDEVIIDHTLNKSKRFPHYNYYSRRTIARVIRVIVDSAAKIRIPTKLERYLTYAYAFAGSGIDIDRFDVVQQTVSPVEINASQSPKDAAIMYAASARAFIAAMVAFCFGNLSAAKHAIRLMPPEEYPWKFLMEGWDGEFLKKVEGLRARNFLYALRDLTPFPDDQFDFNDLPTIEAWFDEHKDHLVWDDVRKEYVFKDEES